MTPNPVRTAAAVASLLVAAGCSDLPTSARTPSLVPAPAAGAVVRGASRIPNAVRYRDAGAKPATGRSGSASLQALALLGRDGVTILEVTSGSVAEPGVARGEISKLQVKQFGPNGTLVETENSKPAAPFHTEELLGLPPGATIQAQANIRGIDRTRTDVVTVTAPVMRRPDLVVSNLLLPPAAVAGVPVIIAASVTESNGDVGARADCALEVDGIQVDLAPGIWVDAGDVVSCAFTYAFPEVPGVKQVVVRTRNASPADDDVSNDAVSGTVDVTVERHAAFSYHALAFNYEIATRDSMHTSIRMPSRPEYESWSRLSSSSRSQGADLYAAMARPVAFPLTQLSLTQRTNGAVVHQAVLDDLTSVSGPAGSACAGSDLEDGISFAICSTGASTDVRYLRRAGTVTYQSVFHSRAWYDDENGVPSYIPNSSTSDGGWTTGAPFLAIGPTFEFEVRVNDGGFVYIRDVAVPIPAATTETVVVPWACSETSAPPLTFTSCSESSRTTISRVGVRGGNAGQP